VQLEEFIREAKFLTALRLHPNLVQVIGYCEDPPMIVMEYLDGGSLEQALRKTAIGDEEKIRICHGIALGMVHLHADGIVHRDLAARNILLTKSMQPKVTDFGLSRAVGESDYGSTKSDVGPVRWMAPEALSKRVFSKKSDVWSFGVLMWEVATNGELPYSDYAAISALIGALAKKKAILKIPDNAPTALAQAINLCLQRDPEQRPNFDRLTEVLQQEEEELPTPSRQVTDSSQYFDSSTGSLENSSSSLREQLASKITLRST
jgi:serine/threonine protein kinase